ncbi:MAG: VCBS repeat-containing protein [Zavarzinella sp.]
MKNFAAIFLFLGCLAPSFALPEPVFWQKTVLDTKFRTEGVAVGDVNKDGKMDILNGEFWYEGPDWKPHEMQKPGNHGTGENGYSKIFACWTDDINKDGWVDLIVIDFPGAPCYWMENPQGKAEHWKKHTIWHSACNETPLYADLFGNGKRVLIMGFQPKNTPATANMGQMAWFAPGKDVTATWEMHSISEPSVPPQMKDGKIVPNTGKIVPGTFRFSHGLGVGDMNKDGRQDVICTGGWWEQPAKETGSPWTFHAANLGDSCADMFAVDMDNDGKMDVVSSSAHRFGIWWHQQKSGNSFAQKDLFRELLSETHAMHYKDIDGDGQPDLITGKRFWSHGRREPGANWPAMLYWFKATRAKDGLLEFKPQVIDIDSGVGTQFAVEDINGDGLLDVAVSNKRGVFVILQVKKESPAVSQGN